MIDNNVCVVIPTYKGSDNIVRAVESVLNQTYKNVEIIVVDDNGKGTDEQQKTEATLKSYIKENRIKYLTHERNINGSAARNTGVRASNGNYIAFLDDDDEYLPENIENHINKFAELSEDYGITYCAKKLFHKDGRTEIITPPSEGDILFDFMCSKIRIGSSFIMVKREAYDAVNGFDESFRRHQDWEFVARILFKYKAGKVEGLGLNKYLLARNSAKNPEQFEKFRIHYLEKLKFVIESFPKEKQQKIYDAHYSQIGKEYFKAKNVKKSIEWALKTSNSAKCIVKYFVDGMKYVARKLK